MKVSEVTLDVIAQYLQIEIDPQDIKEVTEINLYLSAAKNYLYEYTGLTEDEAEEYEHLTPLILLMISDMYENKTLEGNSNFSHLFNRFILINKKVSL